MSVVIYSESDETFFPRFLTAVESMYSICPLTERNSSSAHSAIAAYNSSEIRSGICFFSIILSIKAIA